MRREWIERLCFALLLSVVVIVPAEPGLGAPIVSVEPVGTSALAGQSFSLDIDVSGVADLYAYQFDLSFDPEILAATSIAEGSFLQAGGATFFAGGAIDNSTGTISFTADTLLGPLAGVDGSGTLATVNLVAVRSGTSPVALSNVVLLDSDLADIDLVTIDGTVEVTSVDGPATLFLLAVGLTAAGLVTLRGRTRRQEP